MSVRIGVGIGAREVRAVLVEGGEVRWLDRVAIPADGDPAEALAELLGRAPRSRWRRPGVRVAVGPHASQIKRLGGLPEVEGRATLLALVRESVDAFFLNGVPLTVTGARPLDETHAWAAVVDRRWIDAAVAAAARHGLSVETVAPAGVVLLGAFVSDRVAWSDGDLRLEVERRDDAPAEVRRVRRRGSRGDDWVGGPEEPRLAPPLEALGEDGELYADAYGAAVVEPSEELVLSGRALRPPGAMRRRIMLPATVGAAAMVALALSPLGALRSARVAEAELADIRASEVWTVAGEGLAQLRTATEALAALDAFHRGRTSRTDALATLAERLPEGAAVERLRIDDLEGSLVALAPDAAALAAALSGSPAFTEVAIDAAVGRASVGGRELDRVTVRFRLVPHEGGAP